MADMPDPASSGDQLINPRPLGDVFSPYFEVYFTNAAGRTKVASTGRGVFRTPVVQYVPESPEEKQLRETIIKSISSMTISSDTGSPFQLTLELTPTYDDGVWILESGIITYMTIITARWGYTTSGGDLMLTDYHYFIVTEPKASFGEDMRITVVANDFVSNSAMRRGTIIQWQRTKYRNDKAILQEICRKTGYELVCTDVVNRSTLAQNQPILNTRTKEPNSVPQLQTDWQFFKALCRQHGVAFYISGKKITVYDPLNPSTDAEKVIYRFKWRKPLEGTHDIPIYNISGSILPSAFLPPAGASGVAVLVVDNSTGKTRYVTKDGTDLPESREAAAALQRVRNNAQLMAMLNDRERSRQNNETNLPGGNTAKPDPPLDRNEVGTVINLAARDAPESTTVAPALDLVKEAAYFSNPRVRISCPGVVDLHPGMLVIVEGTGKIYDFTYTVKSVKHSLSSNGYDMDVELWRQGTRIVENVPDATRQPTKDVPMPNSNDTGSVPTNTATQDTPRPARPRRVS